MRSVRLYISVAALLSMAAAFGLSSLAAAEVDMDSPAVQSLMNTPTMQKGISAMEKGDYRSGATLFRDAARHGNLMAEVLLGQMYFDGKGVPINKVQALLLLKNVIEKNQEPTRSMASETLSHIAVALRNSPNLQDRQLGLIATLIPIGGNPYIQQWSRNMRNARVIPYFVC